MGWMLIGAVVATGWTTPWPSSNWWIKTARCEDNEVEAMVKARYESMATSPLSVVIKHLMADFGPDGGGMTDGELLTRFLNGRDDNALAALVWRHAPMVWGVCCRLLHNRHDAEDAFQATFLVLVRKAADVPRQAVANWLYGVARQTAVRLRATTAKRGRRETQVVNMPEPTVAEVRDADWQSVLDEELGRLPDHYRGVLVLCDLEGMTRKEAARQVGIPEGSVASRLARARVLLAKRLTQRGVVFSGGSVAAVLSAGSASASAPPALVASTIEAVTLVAAGQATATGVISAKVAALTDGVVKAMFLNQLKSALAVVLVILGLGMATFGLGILADGGPNRQARELNVIFDEHDGQVEPKDAGQQPAPPKPPPAKTDQERMVGGWVIVKNDGDRKRMGEDWLIGEGGIVMYPNHWGFRIVLHFHRLDATKTPKQIDITVTKTNKEHVGVIKGIYAFANDNELRLCLGEIGRDRPTEFAGKPGLSEFLILQRGDPATWQRKVATEALIDKALAAHGGEDKLNKLTSFTMTVKHSNGETQHYFVQPTKNFRWETTHRDRTGKRIVILFPEGRRWWTKEPTGDAKEFIPTGVEPRIEYWLDYVKFFGPRQVLRLKDADHKVALLDEEVMVDGRAAVGVELNGTLRMYFDKETHLLVKRGAITYSDYKTFDGIPIAQKEHDGHFEPEVTDFRAVDKFDAKLFEQP